MLNNQKGFTMIEMMGAIMIFGLTMLGAVAMNIAAIKGNATGNFVTKANMMAKEKMEECVMHAWDLDEGTYSDKDGMYVRTWKVESHTNRSKRVIVWVAYAPAMGNPKTIKLQTLVGVEHSQLYNGLTTDGKTSWDQL